LSAISVAAIFIFFFSDVVDFFDMLSCSALLSEDFFDDFDEYREETFFDDDFCFEVELLFDEEVDDDCFDFGFDLLSSSLGGSTELGSSRIFLPSTLDSEVALIEELPADTTSVGPEVLDLLLDTLPPSLDVEQSLCSACFFFMYSSILRVAYGMMAGSIGQFAHSATTTRLNETLNKV